MAGEWGSKHQHRTSLRLRWVPPAASPCVTLLIALLLMAVLAESVQPTKKRPPQETASTELNPRAVCSQLVLLGNRKKNTLTTLKRSKDRINHDKKLSDSEKGDRLQVLDLFTLELTASERALLTVVKDYERTLKIDFQSLDDIGSSCEKRLEDMRAVSLQVEKDYHTFHTLHREIKMHHDNISLPGSIMEEILRTLTHAADELEVELLENVFDAAVAKGNVEVETVVKLPGGVRDHAPVAGGNVESLVLVDPDSNQYTLSRPQDTTVSHEDHNLLHDVLLLFLLCSVLGMAVSWLRAPSLFGYILAGVLLGPSGFNVIKSVVQVETMGEFGVFLIMFVVGLEFSPEKLQKVWRVSVYGGNSLWLLNVLVGVVLGWGLGMDVKQSFFVASCLSLSSTPLVVRYLEAESHSLRSPVHATDQAGGSRPQSEDVPTLLLGLLVMQDIQLGGIVALLPLLSSRGVPGGTTSWGRVAGLARVVCGVGVLVLMARVCYSPRMERLLRLAKVFLAKKEGILLAAIGVCFATVLIADLLGVSLELGCFLAGLTIGAKGHGIVDRVSALVEPVKDIASCLFFISIGFHIFPTFLMSEFYTVVVFTTLAIFVKFVSSFTVLGCFTGRHRWSTFIISTGIAQISEFTFVLGSRGRRLGILSREVYLLMLSSTIVSLLLSPFIWKTALALATRRDPMLWGKLPPASGGSAKYG